MTGSLYVMMRLVNHSNAEMGKQRKTPYLPRILFLPMLRLLSSKAQGCKVFENHVNPVMLVLIGLFLPSTLRSLPICQGFSQILVGFFALFSNGQISHHQHKHKHIPFSVTGGSEARFDS